MHGNPTGSRALIVASSPSLRCYYCALMRRLLFVVLIFSTIALFAQKQSFTIEQILSSPFGV